jgi:hypothetical protein
MVHILVHREVLGHPVHLDIMELMVLLVRLEVAAHLD